jgi:pimeloyl-ACP methyl ester carboxylesterase
VSDFPIYIFYFSFKASVEHNAMELKQYIEEIYWGSGKPVMLLGHSKGGIDAAAALSLYWSDLKDKVAGLALVQSPYGGTPIASDILREGQIGDKETRRILEIIICKVIKVTISHALKFVSGLECTNYTFYLYLKMIAEGKLLELGCYAFFG